MFRICLLYSLVIFVGCVSTTKMGDPEPKQTIIAPKKKEPRVIRIFPQIPMPIQDQIKWFERLEAMPPEERSKIERALIDGMFKPISEMERLRMLYPLQRDPMEI